MTIVAIDFGTSNTIVAYRDPLTQVPCTMAFAALTRQFVTPTGAVAMVPSIVAIQPHGAVVGETVRQQRLGCADPPRYFAAFKRDLLAAFQPPPRSIDGHAYDATAIATLFLTTVWRHICQQVEPTQVIMTVPTGAFEPYGRWLRSVAAQLEFPQPTWLDESTAAALGYAVQTPGCLCLVVDCGGGTLDLSLVRTQALNAMSGLSGLQAQVLAKSDADIGGVDIDIWLVEDYLRRQGMSRSSLSPIAWQTLLEIAERIKIQLSQTAFAQDSWFDDEQLIAYELSVDQVQLAEILEAQQFLEQFRQSLDEVLVLALDKGIQRADIDQVLLVGGICQMPAIQQLLGAYFGRARLRSDKPLEAVAHGALAIVQVDTVTDELRHSYAIRLWQPHSRRYDYYPLFAAGTRYPVERSEPLVLQVAIEGQTEICLDVGELAAIKQAEVNYDSAGRMISSVLHQADAFRSLQAARSLQAGLLQAGPSAPAVVESICLARLDPPGQLGVDRIVVKFAVTGDRVLIVTVRDLLTQQVLVAEQAVAQLR
jgi:molecular chaperone DnaK (HSP70)